MIVILKDKNTTDPDVVMVTETTTGKQIQEIIDKVRITCGDTDNYDFEAITKQLPDDVRFYTDWDNEFDVIYW